jgi:flagellar basal body-associated protein FliL
MTEMQPTEIELTGRPKKKLSLSKRKIVAFVALVIFIVATVILTVMLANRASRTPEIIQPQPQALPAGDAVPEPQAAPEE